MVSTLGYNHVSVFASFFPSSHLPCLWMSLPCHCVRSLPRVGPSIQKPFSEYLEAQRSKLHHHTGEGTPAVRALLPSSILPKHVILLIAKIIQIVMHSCQSRVIFLCMHVSLCRLRTGWHGSLRRWFWSWSVTLSSPSSTPWLRATPSDDNRVGSRGTLRRKPSDKRLTN